MTDIDYRRTANWVLAVVFAIFAAAAWLRHLYPGEIAVRLLLAVAEAALVGGIADWFAVTAIFRRPLGFPWHTALVPRGRERVIAAIAGAVQNELLNRESIKSRLAGVCLTEVAIRWLEDQNRQALLPAFAARYVQAAWVNLDCQAVARYGQKWLKAILRATDLAGYGREGLAWALASGKADRLVEGILAEITAVAARDGTRRTIEKHLEQYARQAAKNWWQRLVLGLAEATDTLNLAEAAAVLHRELVQVLRDLAAEDHPLREWIRSRLAAAADQLANDPAWAANIAAWQKGLAVRLNLKEALAAVAEAALADIPPERPALWAAGQTEKLWQAFKNDPAWQSWAEERLQAILGKFIDREHDLVAMAAKDALNRLSDEDLNRFIENKAGEDLAWIRINGSVVGGVVGLLLFLFIHYFYHPYVAPLIRACLG